MQSKSSPVGKDDPVLARAAWGSLLLAIFKFAAYLTTGSVLLLATFLDSVGDSIVSLINHKVQSASRARPDREHPFGHGGYEVISSLVQGSVLTSFGIMIVVESITRLATFTRRTHELENLGVGIATLVVAAAGGLVLQAYLAKHKQKLDARRERSLSINADRAHYLADFWVNAASALALTLMALTGWEWLDPLFGLAGAAMLIRTALPILTHGVRDILHTEIEANLQREIVQTVLESDPSVQGIHRLRGRRYGPTLFLDFHLKLSAELSLQAAHDVGEVVRRKLRHVIPDTDVIIHLDPDTEPDDELWDPAYKT